MNNIIKIIKSLEDSSVLIDGVAETVKHEIKKQEGWFSCVISATSNFFSSKTYKWKRNQKSRTRIFKEHCLVPLHPLNNIEITNYFNYESKFDGVCSINHLPRIKNGIYVINLDDKHSNFCICFISLCSC